MARKDDEEPVVLNEPTDGSEDDMEDQNIWLRGLWMLVFIALMWVARGIMIVAAVIQFFWMLFASARNPHVAAFGEDLGDWMARATIYVTGATEDRPFPFDRWGIPD